MCCFLGEGVFLQGIPRSRARLSFRTGDCDCSPSPSVKGGGTRVSLPLVDLNGRFFCPRLLFLFGVVFFGGFSFSSAVSCLLWFLLAFKPRLFRRLCIHELSLEGLKMIPDG